MNVVVTVSGYIIPAVMLFYCNSRNDKESKCL